MATKDDLARLRTPPPDFRRLVVRSVAELTPHLRRVTLGGEGLDGIELDAPAASVRILVPEPGADELVLPTWQGNEFRYDDGARPSIRTFTPRAHDAAARELAIDVVDHPGGVVSSWARTARPGDEVALSGPGRGYELDAGAVGHVLAGDETALPAIAQLVAAIPDGTPVRAIVEVRDDSARLPELDAAAERRAEVEVEWLVAGERGEALVGALRAVPIEATTAVWVAGEAAVMQAVRGVLRDERDVERSRTTVRGYWKDRSPAG